MKRPCVFWISLFLLVGLLSPVVWAQGNADKIEPELLAQFASGRVDFVVRFVEQADLSPAYEMSWEERGWFVYDTLQEVTARSQSRAKAYLDSRGLAYHTFIAGNELYVWAGDLLAANALAALPEVAYVWAARTFYINPIIEEDVSNVPEGIDALAWGIVDTQADQFWSAFGLQGDGIVVANIDSGVQWDHPALDQAYKCPGDPGNAACWFDPANVCGGTPCDNAGRGTFTMGTMVGDDDPALTWQAGMAPNAQWIACKGCETLACSEASLYACADWLLAPGGSPDNRPHVVNSSGGSDSGCDPWFLAKVQAWRAAGIFPTFPAGSATGCGSLGSPGDYQESLDSTGHNASRHHAYAQGPSCYGHEPYTKPNLTAPAVQICSALPGDGWSCNYSGTTVASPHAAGAVALLWSCQPALVGQIDPTFEALQDHADPPDPPNPPCGVPPDNEGTYEDGYGYLNVFSAGMAHCAGVQVGWLDGYVYDAGTSNPIQGASVTAAPGYAILATTDPTGYYTMTLPVGTYDVTASKAGYFSETVAGITITANVTTSQDFYLTWQGQWTPGPSNPPFQYNRFDGVFNPVDGLIYFPGGRTGGSTHDRSIYSYDPLNDLWADTTCDMMHNAASITAVLLEDDGTGRGEAIYVFGGYDVVAAVNIPHVQRYYPSQAGCVVETVTTDPYPDTSPADQVIDAGGVAEVNGKVYVFGGWENVTPYFSNKTWEYDPAAAAGSRWTELAATLTPARSYIQVAVQGGLIYAMGGHISYAGSDLVPTDVAQVYDPSNPGAGWTAIASMPVASAEGRGFGFDMDSLGVTAPWTGKIYVAGGGDWPDQSAEALEYDIATNTWDQAFPDLITARRDHAGAFVPLCTLDPTDGLPGMWVFGGRITGDNPPYGNPEYFPLPCAPLGPPTAAFTADPTEGCAPLEVQFSDESTGDPPIHAWLWEFGDGFTSTLQHPTHTYGVSGTYVVWLTVDNISGTDSVSDTITVLPVPEASFDYAPPAGLIPLTVLFTNTSAYAISPTWDFGDGGIGSGDTISHTYVSAGDYTVTLNVGSPYSCGDDEATSTVTALCDPVTGADFTWSPQDPVLPATILFTATASPPTATEPIAYTWDWGDGSLGSGATSTHSYAAGGDYSVTLSVSNSCGMADVTYLLRVCEPVHDAGMSWVPVTPTTGAVITFTGMAVGTGQFTYTWDLGDGTTAHGAVVTHTYTLSDSYTVVLTVTGACSQTTAIAVIRVITPVQRWEIYLPLVFKNASGR